MFSKSGLNQRLQIFSFIFQNVTPKYTNKCLLEKNIALINDLSQKQRNSRTEAFQNILAKIRYSYILRFIVPEINQAGQLVEMDISVLASISRIQPTLALVKFKP